MTVSPKQINGVLDGELGRRYVDITFFATASGLMIEKVRSTAILSSCPISCCQRAFGLWARLINAGSPCGKPVGGKPVGPACHAC